MVPRLLLITNRKSFTGFRLPPKAMALDDLEHQNRVFMDFLAILGCNTFQKRIAPKSRDGPRQTTDETFSIKHSFHSVQIPPPVFKELST